MGIGSACTSSWPLLSRSCLFIYINTSDTYTFPGPVIVRQLSLVQNSEITPYIKFTWLKNDIAETRQKKCTC